MKKTVKLLSLVAAFAMAVTMTGCGNKAGNDVDETADNEQKAVLTMATNAEFKPFEYLEGEEIVGADIDMAKAIAEKLGCEIEITNIDFDAALTGAATGKYDIAVAGITASDTNTAEAIVYITLPRIVSLRIFSVIYGANTAAPYVPQNDSIKLLLYNT